jgi:hypothetical protein
MTTAKKDMENTKDDDAVGIESTALFALADTRIEMAGVMRCCLGTVAEEYEGKDGTEDQKVSPGMKSQCRHCKEPFTLTEAKPHPKWKPDWQIHGANAKVEGARSEP